MNLSPLYWLFFSFLGGVFVMDMIRSEWALLLVFLALLLPIFQKRKSLFHFGGTALGFIAGGIFLLLSLPNIEHFALPNIAAQEKEVTLLGQIDSFPLQKNGRTEFYIQVRGFQEVFTLPDSKEKHYSEVIILDQKERVLVKQYGLHDFEYAQRVLVQGKIQTPGEWEKFSYDRFLAKEGVFSIIPNARVSSLQEHLDIFPHYTKWEDIWIQIFAVRQQFEEEVRKKLEFPTSEYALGIMLGAEAGIPENIIEDFNATGLRHLLALSGFNITILILFLFWVFFWLPKWIRITLTAIVIFLFVGLTGGSSSVVRAAVMGVLGLIALHSGRKMKPVRLVILALFCITLWNPFLLFSDASLQFSVLAVLGLVYIVPLLEKYVPLPLQIPQIFREVLYATLAAQIATLPLMLVMFEQVSLISPLANLIVAPLTTLSMIFGFAVAFPLVGWFAVPLAYFLLSFALWIAKVLADVPYAVVNVDFFSLWAVFPMYVLLGFILVMGYRSVK